MAVTLIPVGRVMDLGVAIVSTVSVSTAVAAKSSGLTINVRILSRRAMRMTTDLFFFVFRHAAFPRWGMACVGAGAVGGRSASLSAGFCRPLAALLVEARL